MPNNVQNLHPSGSVTGFGRVVSDARRAKRLTQQEAADLLGMSRRTLIDIEADRITPKRFEKAGILAVLSPAATTERHTWRRVLLGSPDSPRVWLDLEETGGQWWAALGFNCGRVGGLDTFKGPFGSREAAERNAAAFGCDFMRARDCTTQERIVRQLFGFRPRANSAQLEIQKTGNYTLEKKTGKGWDVLQDGELIAEFFGPAGFVGKALTALQYGEKLDAGFEQRHSVEVYLPDGSSPSGADSAP